MSRWAENENPDEPVSRYERWIIQACWRPEGNQQDTAKTVVAKTAEQCRETVAQLRTSYGSYPQFWVAVDVEMLERSFENGKPVVRVVDRRPAMVRGAA